MAINYTFTFGRDSKRIYLNKSELYFDDTDIAPEVEKYDVYTNFGRSPIVAIVPDVGEWFDRRDRSLAGWSAGWLHFQGATSCLREYGRKRTRRKGRYGRTRRSRGDPFSCPNVQGPERAHRLVPAIARFLPPFAPQNIHRRLAFLSPSSVLAMLIIFN